ncbi:MAG TPA: nuclear transport factor 2 family protein [Candidatus Acidoferrales bacterium]|nr:nuclear transport factor 2 family protein [Candidatus Acidoferrales bacterium]
MTHRQLLQSLFDAWRTGDALRAVAHFAVDGSYREAHADAIVGRDAIAAHFTRFFRDGPAWRFAPEEIIVEANRAAVRYGFEVEGRDGVWHERTGCAFVTFANGVIAEWREFEG